MSLLGTRLRVSIFIVTVTIWSAPVSVTAAMMMFATEGPAVQACSGDEVVWIDLSGGRFYHKDQPAYGKAKNGGYACMKTARAQYREGHS